MQARNNKISGSEGEYKSFQESCEAKDHELQNLQDRVGRRDEPTRLLEAEFSTKDNIIRRKLRGVDNLTILRGQLLR